MISSLSVRSLLLTVVCGVAPCAVAQVAAFQFDEQRAPQGVVYQYLKTNRDGSHPGRISVYAARTDRLESLKWDPDSDRATLVVAELDWARYSVKRFESWRLSRGEAPTLQATLTTADEGRVIKMSLSEAPVAIAHWPWHSYDFDFASLSFTLPHWRNPEGELAIWRTDFVYSDPPQFAELGELRLRYERTETRADRTVRRYAFGGPGFEGASGTWWSDAKTGLLVEFELPVADEPGYEDGRLRLQDVQPMTRAEWERFKREKVGE